MRDLDQVKHHHIIEDIVDILCNKTQNTGRGFFRIEVAYFLAKMAASMRAKIQTKDRGEIPVNVYALALATSGYGKGHSVSIMESEFLSGFRKRFMEDTFPVIAEQNLWKLAVERAASSGETEDHEKEKLDKEFRLAGALAFTFDSATPAAVKQMRQKLLLADNGSINMQIDEIGSNLIGSTDVLTVFLELYDQGQVKQKLTKNTAENIRGEELEGKTPTNALLFGTPSKLLDGGQTEEAFYSFLDIGYARRCLFAWGETDMASREVLTPAEIYKRLTEPKNTSTINSWANHFAVLADPTKFNWVMTVDDTVGIELLTYKIQCEKLAAEMAEHEDIRKAEMSHRYFKALKLAGALAFIEESSEITMDQLYSAIKLVEESGQAFQRLMTREKAYVKLARYIAANKGTELTHADLHEALPFYKSGNAARKEMMDLAVSHGYKNHIIIRKTYADNGIELFSGETLEETDLSKIGVSYSNHFAYNYLHEEVPFDQLHVLTQAQGMHWANHGFKGGHRAEEAVIPGFNMVAIDVDGGVSLDAAHELMQEYKFLTYTTKRHSQEQSRFRLMLPINYKLFLEADDYKEFMNNIMEWLPFETDSSANQRAKKWESFDGGTYHYNDGELLDSLKFIPKTSKNELHQQTMQELGSLDNLERWFAGRIASGNRNNQMIKYALALVDTGMDYTQIEESLIRFNSQLPDNLSEDELRSTILVTVAKKIHGSA